MSTAVELSAVAGIDALTRTPAVLLASFYVGNMFSRMRLPKITGYLATGVLCGPQGFGLLSMYATRKLWPVDNLCLALIGIAAGSELSVLELGRKDFRNSVLKLTFFITLCTWAFIFPTVLLLAEHIHFLKDADHTRRIAVASLAATLGIARSPASMIAVLRELAGKGPFCSLAMSVTVVKDVLVLLMFAMNMEIVAAAEQGRADGSLAEAANKGSVWVTVAKIVVGPAVRLCVSVVAGLAGGYALGWGLHPRLGIYARGALALGMAAGMYLGARAMHGEPLLVCVVAGILAGNRRGDRGEKQREELHRLLSVLQPTVNLAFFTLAGCALAVNLLAATAPVAAAIHLVRMASLVAATMLSGRALPKEFGNVWWMAMVTQAGVALGLARAVVARFPGWGDDFYVLMVATIVLNQAVGPPLFRAAIVTVGEAHTKGDGGPVADALETKPKQSHRALHYV